MFSNIFAFILHLPISYVIGVHFKMGLEGVAYATTIHFMNRLLIISIFIRFSKFNNHLVPILDPESFRNIWPQFIMSL